MEVVRWAILQARVWGWQNDVPAEQLADLMDAVHNIPYLVEHWENCDQAWLKRSLEDYERKWAKSDGPCLRTMYEQALTKYANTDQHNENAMRTVSSDPEVLQHAAHDAINIFVRDVLIPNGLIAPDACNEQQFRDALVSVARRVSENWKQCKINDQA